MNYFCTLAFSVNFQLIAAMNPCPCGWLNEPQKACGCAPAVVTKYQKRISAPLLDRIDIHIEVPRVDHEKLVGIGWGRRQNRSARAYHRILKLARTIADLAGSEGIQSAHLAEALHASRSSEVDGGIIIAFPIKSYFTNSQSKPELSARSTPENIH
jgi:predicted ATPase with chaperone activity